VAEGELVVQLGATVVGPAGVLRGRLSGGLARDNRPLTSVMRAGLGGAGGVIARLGAPAVGLHGWFSTPHGLSR